MNGVMDPYRANHTAAIVKPKRSRELLVGLAIVWAFAIARVGLALYLKQTFGAELTLATLAVLFIPLLLRRG